MRHGISVRQFTAGFEADLFANVEFVITDLPGATLGLTAGNTITTDINADGWFVSPDSSASGQSPKNAEAVTAAQRIALESRRRLDLLTVIMHELGHVAGLPDLYDSAAEDDLMYGWVEPGARRTSLAASLADDAFAGF